MVIVLEGKKTTGEPFRKEIENNNEELTSTLREKNKFA